MMNNGGSEHEGLRDVTSAPRLSLEKINEEFALRNVRLRARLASLDEQIERNRQRRGQR